MTELLTSTVLEQLELGNITRDDAKAQIATIVQQAQQAAAGAGATAANAGGSADMRLLVAEIMVPAAAATSMPELSAEGYRHIPFDIANFARADNPWLPLQHTIRMIASACKTTHRWYFDKFELLMDLDIDDEQEGSGVSANHSPRAMDLDTDDEQGGSDTI